MRWAPLCERKKPISKASTVLLRSSSRFSCFFSVLQKMLLINVNKTILHMSFCLINAWWSYDNDFTQLMPLSPSAGAVHSFGTRCWPHVTEVRNRSGMSGSGFELNNCTKQTINCCTIQCFCALATVADNIFLHLLRRIWDSFRLWPWPSDLKPPHLLCLKACSPQSQ